MSKEGMSGWGKMGLVGASVAALSIGMCAAEPIASRLAGGEPPPPSLPPVPERVTAERGPMEVVVGFDTTRSSIMRELPGVVGQTRDFFAQTGIFKQGDVVRACTFAEEAKCEPFQMPQEQGALAQHVGRIQPEAPRAGMMTHVHSSVAEMVEETTKKDALVLGWTDGKDDEAGAKAPLQAGHPPVAIIVPRSDYRGDAESVKSSLGGRGVEIAVASTSEEFGGLLERFAGELQREAQGRAQVIADQKYEVDLADHETKKREYEEDVRTLNDRRAEFVGKVKRFKMGVYGVLVGLATLITALAVRESNKQKDAPKVRYLLDKRGKFSKPIRFKVSRKQPAKLTVGDQGFLFEVTNEGVVCNHTPLTDGKEIMPKVTYHERSPGI